jgi:hypothetical protein
MTAAIAIVFLLNGAPVQLPAPAVMIDNTAYVSARAVFEKLGWEISSVPDNVNGAYVDRPQDGFFYLLDTSSNEVRVEPGPVSRAFLFPTGGVSVAGDLPSAPQLPPPLASLRASAPPRVIHGVFYMPVRTVALITGGRVAWEGATMTVNLIADVAGKFALSEIGAIVADPPKWKWKRVWLRGEYTGSQADPLGPATTHGPPVTNDDWTIRDATGSLYCDSALYDSTMHGGGVAIPPIKLDPIKDLGRRLEVVGTVELTKDGWPYLVVEEITLLPEHLVLGPFDRLAGITCYLTTDKNTYQPGDTIKMQMLVRNPAPMVVVGEAVEGAETLNFNTSQQYDFVVSDAAGKTVWKWSQGMMFAQMLTEKALLPGDSYTVTAQWALPGTLPPAHYKVSGLINRDVQSYVKTVAVGG